MGVLYEMIHAVQCMYSVQYFVWCCHCCGSAVQWGPNCITVSAIAGYTVLYSHFWVC